MLVLVAATAFFVAVEFSLVAVDRSEVELAAAEGDRRAVLVAGALRRLSFHLSGVQLGITVCSVGIGVLAQPNIATLLQGPLDAVVGSRRSEAVSVVLALLIATVVQMLVGELIPKAIAVGRPLGTARFLAPAERVYSGFFRPVIVLFGSAADSVVRLFGVEPKEELSQVRSRHELAKLVESSGAEGTLGAAEVELLTRTFRFRDKTVAEVLTPRTAVEALSIDDRGADLRQRSIDTGFSRFVLAGADLDDVVGIVHVKSLFDLPPEERDEVPLSRLSTEALMVPESRQLDSMLVEMRATATYLAVVLDEYGGTAGIVTLEDLLEEIVGEIDDEHDLATGRASVWSWGGTSVLSGRLNLDEVFDSTGLRLPDGDGDFETLAGFVLAQLGRIPEVGDGFTFEDWTFEVLEMDRHRVATVRLVEPLRPERRSADRDGGDSA
ncbi:MAG: hemolysin family protein [Acidimicrobiales bacterium]